METDRLKHEIEKLKRERHELRGLLEKETDIEKMQNYNGLLRAINKAINERAAKLPVE